MSSLSRKHLPQLSVSASNIEDIMSRAYDSFEVQLSSLQFLYSKLGLYTRVCSYHITSHADLLAVLLMFCQSIKDAHVCMWNKKNLCVTDGNWKMARKQKQSPLHILEPVDLKVIFSRAMVVKDSRMAK